MEEEGSGAGAKKARTTRSLCRECGHTCVVLFGGVCGGIGILGLGWLVGGGRRVDRMSAFRLVGGERAGFAVSARPSLLLPYRSQCVPTHLCPESVAGTKPSVGSRLQTFTVRSLAPVTRKRPQGDQATEVTSSAWAP